MHSRSHPPLTSFICTSREPLRIRGERVIAVGPLDADDAQHLFVDLAATVAPGGTLSAPDARDVATICSKLDGIPLALELAAACARVLDLEHIASGLDERFRLLMRGSRASSDRHTTLRATIAWSYDMLEDSVRTVFERAAIFNGRFSFDDLLAVAMDDHCDRTAVLEATTALVEKSLVVVETDRETSRRRYRLLDSVRAFAAEAARTRNGDTALVEPHRRWGRHLRDRLRRSIEGYRNAICTPLGDVQMDHIRGYLDWAIEKRNDVAAGTALAAEIHLVWDHCGLFEEGMRRIETGLSRLSREDANGPAAMHGWYAVARLNQRFTRYAESLEPGLRAYEIAGIVGDEYIRASSAAKLAVAFDGVGKRSDALVYAREAMSGFDRIGDRNSAAYNACVAAVIAFKIHGDASTLDGLRVAVEGLRSLGDARRTASMELDLGEAYYAYGDVDAAIGAVRSAVVQFRETSSPLELAFGLTNLGVYLSSSGQLAEGTEIAEEALQIGRDHYYSRIIVIAAQTCATIAALAGLEQRRCVEILGFVARRYETIGAIGFTERAAHEMLRTAVSGFLPPADYAEAIRAGEAFDDDSAILAAMECTAATRALLF